MMTGKRYSDFGVHKNRPRENPGLSYTTQKSFAGLGRDDLIRAKLAPALGFEVVIRNRRRVFGHYLIGSGAVGFGDQIDLCGALGLAGRAIGLAVGKISFTAVQVRDQGFDQLGIVHVKVFR